MHARQLVEAKVKGADECLIWAARRGYIEIVKMVLATGKPRSRVMIEALFEAGENGHLEILTALAQFATVADLTETVRYLAEVGSAYGPMDPISRKSALYLINNLGARIEDLEGRLLKRIGKLPRPSVRQAAHRLLTTRPDSTQP